MKSLIALTVGLFISTNAWATNYECNSTQATELRKHRLVQLDTKDSSAVNSILRFNSESGDMWIADNGAPLGPLPFKIVHEDGAYQNITAVFDGPDNALPIGSTFQTWEEKDKKIVFLLFISSAKRLLTGTCHKYDKEIMKIDRDQLNLKTF